MNRRHLLTTAIALPFAACAGTTTTLTPAEIVSEGSTFVTGFANAFNGLITAAPALMPQATSDAITADLTKAQTAIAAFNATLPAATGASTMQTILGYVNAALNVLGAPPINGLIPAPFNEAIAAVAVLAPVLETWVESIIPTAAASQVVAAARAKVAAAKPGMTPNQALVVLLGYGG